jgi:hypothetical protein
VIGLINNFVITFTRESRLKTVNSKDDNENVCETFAVIVFTSSEVYWFTALHCLNQKLVNENYMHI